MIQVEVFSLGCPSHGHKFFQHLRHVGNKGQVVEFVQCRMPNKPHTSGDCGFLLHKRDWEKILIVLEARP